MKFTTILAIGSAGAALLAIPAIAQNNAADPAQPAGRMRPMAEMTRAQAEQMAGSMFDRMDTNRDGTLDAADRAAHQQARFARLDTDGNGQLSAEEFGARADRAKGGRDGMQQGRLRGPVPGGPGGPAADGRAITRSQFTADALARFDRADADRDGTVTREERRAARPQRAPRAGGPPSTIQ